jgi:hypothetical protein
MLIVPSFRFRTFIQNAMSHVQEALDFATLHPTRLLRKRAALQSARYVADHMPGALSFYTSQQVLAFSLSRISLSGLILEFGVFRGGTIRYMAKRFPDRIIHGFDSFEGLPVAWQGTGHAEGAFHARGRMPRVPANVRLHRGFFDATLPLWAQKHPDPLAFIHVDCDLYESTKTIFDVLGPRIGPGVVIVFDDYFSYPGWQLGEHKAFQEFIAQSGLRFLYLCHGHQQVAVKICE